MDKVEEFLQKNNINYILHEHPAIYTCEEAEKYCDTVPGLACKNLFLTNKKRTRFFLLILPAAKQANLKIFSNLVGENKIIFANSKDLQDKLSLTAGAVSPFGLLNDQLGEVEVYIDQLVYDADIVSFHPNRNTASIELNREMFHKFMEIIKNKIQISSF